MFFCTMNGSSDSFPPFVIHVLHNTRHLVYYNEYLLMKTGLLKWLGGNSPISPGKVQGQRGAWGRELSDPCLH